MTRRYSFPCVPSVVAIAFAALAPAALFSAGLPAQGYVPVASPQGIHGVAGSDVYGGSGQCVADFDGDGDVDVVASSPVGTPFRYFRNDGGLMFTDLTATCGLGLSGVTLGMRAADIDNDGDQDIFVTQGFGPMQMFMNAGDGTFTDEATARGLTWSHESYGASFGDYDRDGLLDLYVANRYLAGAIMLNNPNFLFRNVGDGYFVDVTNAAGVGGIGLSLCTVFWDYNEDNWPDLIEVNDKGATGAPPNEVYRNNGDGTFTAVGASIAANNNVSGMAFDFCDVFNDGGVDFYCSDIPFDHLFNQWMPALNSYSDDTAAYGLTGGELGWAANFLDYDNDGWQDLYQVHEFMPNTFMRNPAAPASAQVVWPNVAPALGLDHFYLQFVSATGDFDDDGQIDILERFAAGPPWLANSEGVVLYRNTVAGGRYLKILPRGTVSNRDGLGARIEVLTGTHLQRQWMRSGTGWLSSSDRRVHFGLGSVPIVDRVSIRWPSGQQQYLTNIATNQILTVEEPHMELAAPAQVGGTTSLDFKIQGDEGLPYIMLLSLSNASSTALPGGASLPLVVDGVSEFTMTAGNSVLPASFGFLNAQGEGGSPLTIPPVPWLMGITLYGTAVTIDPVNFPLFRTVFPTAVPITIQ
ncbi:MAG: hypothetical protein ACI8UD_004326 [Planctomycetota bacterium]|jgi:hypothetical protein